MLELPSDFIHEPPKNYTYEVKEFRRNILSIWCCNHAEFSYNGGAVAKTIWGFYNTKQGRYYAPVNSTKCGDQVDIHNTCLLYTSPSPRDRTRSRMPSSA